MAKITDNVLTRGLSGKIGDLVFRTRKGKTYVSAAPTRSANKRSNPRQLEIQEKFARCVEYAKWACRIPELKEFYTKKAKRGQTVYNVAFADAAHGPEICEVFRMDHLITKELNKNEINSQSATDEQCILIHAQDNGKVDLVHVEIFTEDGSQLLEAGPAREQPFNSMWIYLMQPGTAIHDKLKVFVTAVDLPGNNAHVEIIC